MTKSELITKLAKSAPNLSKKQIEFIVNTVFDTIKQSLAEGDKVELRGFGSFRTRTKRSKTGRNPKTGEKVEVNESKVPGFRPGKEIKEALIAKD